MHTLQHKYRKLDAKEAENVLHKYNIGLSQLPKISINDSAFGDEKMSRGDIIEINREDSVYYRVVI